VGDVLIHQHNPVRLGAHKHTYTRSDTAASSNSSSAHAQSAADGVGRRWQCVLASWGDVEHSLLRDTAHMHACMQACCNSVNLPHALQTGCSCLCNSTCRLLLCASVAVWLCAVCSPPVSVGVSRKSVSASCSRGQVLSRYTSSDTNRGRPASLCTSGRQQQQQQQQHEQRRPSQQQCLR
jgi:hypothetical protein